MLPITRTLFTTTALVTGLMASVAAQAGTSTLTLSRASLTNVSDAAGIYQHEGGKILNASGASIGTYIIVRRVTPSGTAAYNTAATTRQPTA